METALTTPTTLEALAARLAELEREHAREVSALRAEVAALGEAAARPAPAPRARAGRGLARLRRGHTDATATVGRTSRRGMLGTAAKVAAATVAAGVLAEQVGTRAAFADNLGNFSSSVYTTPAVSATGTGGADGVNASSDGAHAIFGSATAHSGMGVYGYATDAFGFGVYALNDSNMSGSIALYAASGDGGGGVGPGNGVYAQATSGYGVYATAVTGTGVFGATGAQSAGVAGAAGVSGSNTSNTSSGIAVLGHSDDGSGNLGPGIGVQGETAGGRGVFGTATTGIGLYGKASAAAGYGLYAENASNTSGSVALYANSNDGAGHVGAGVGVQGATASGTGVVGAATTGVGVYGSSAGGGGTQAMYGVGTSGSTGLRATSDSGNGIVALSTSGTGLNVQSASGSAVIATSNGVGYGLYLTAPSGWAIGCNGRLRMLGPAVGTATLAHGTTTKTVTSTACSGGSQVILTPTSNPQVSIWATVAPGAFTIHASAAPASDVSFSYLLIN